MGMPLRSFPAAVSIWGSGFRLRQLGSLVGLPGGCGRYFFTAKKLAPSEGYGDILRCGYCYSKPGLAYSGYTGRAMYHKGFVANAE